MILNSTSSVPVLVESTKVVLVILFELFGILLQASMR
jgi:hypothetical protein